MNRSKLFTITTIILILAVPKLSLAEKHKYNDYLTINVKNNYILSSKYFGVIDFYFYNNSQEWIRIKKPNISFANKKIDENIILTQGVDLLIWSEATRIWVEKNQKQAAIAGALIGGLALGVAFNADNQFGQMLAGTIAVTALASPSLLRFNEDYDSGKSEAIFPSNHLLGGAIFIPPGLSIKRWIVVNTINHKEIGFIEDVRFGFQVNDEDPKKVNFRFRSKPDPNVRNNTKPPWQGDLVPLFNYSD